MNRFLGALVALLIAAGAASADSESTQATPAQSAGPHVIADGAWICPPCGADCDTLHFDGPGACPHCGMRLVPASITTASELPRVAILLFDGVQIIDYSGPWEVFGEAGFRTFTVAPTTSPVTTVFGQHVTADYTLANAPEAEVLLVPGGSVNKVHDDPTVIQWIHDRAAHSKVVMSVCTGAFLLAKAGLLDGLSATTFHNAIDALADEATHTRVVHDQRFVDNGRIITTAGLSSGIDGALHVVSKLRSPARARAVALNLEYRWDPNDGYARAAFADRYLPNFRGIDADVLTSDGDRTHWTIEARVHKPNTPAMVMEETAKQIVSGTPHRRSDVTLTRHAGIGTSGIRWHFVDDEGHTWRGSGTAHAASGEPDQVMVTLSLTRS